MHKGFRNFLILLIQGQASTALDSLEFSYLVRDYFNETEHTSSLQEFRI